MNVLSKSSGLVRIKISGSNWYNFVEVDFSNFDPNSLDMFIEAATLGAEAFLKGEYSSIEPGRNVGFGSLIIAENEDDGRSASIRSDVVLANAGLHKDAAELKKIIDQRKKN